MPTGKNVLKSVTEIMAGYKPIYTPIAPLFLSGAKQYVEEVGKLEFRAFEAVSDLDAKHITPKDTEMHQVAISEGSKYFKKYFLGNQLQISQFQSQEGADKAIAQVLDRHNLLFDIMLLTGEGTSDSTMVNNGLFWSNDANYVLNNSAQISATTPLWALHAQIMTQAAIANQVAGRKVLVTYGDTSGKINQMLPGLSDILKSPLAKSLGSAYSIVELPADATPASAHGYMIVNLDQIQVHYMTLPKIQKNGSNEEKNYNWTNFIMGSVMVSCEAPKAIIRQPLTWA